MSLVSGIIGDRAAVSFFNFVNSKKIPSAAKILEGDFEENKKLLNELTFTDFTQLNEAVFRWLEKTCDKTGNEVAKNLEAYFDWFALNDKNELQAHFASLISAERYPEALNYIFEKAPVLYHKLLDLSSEL